MKIASRNFPATEPVLAHSGFVLGQANGGSDHAAQPEVSSPATAQQPAAPNVKNSSGADYVIGNNDMLGINVWNEQQLTQSVPVRSDGKISLPLIGEVQATGRTPLQLKDDITAKLQSFLSAPNVTAVTVLQIKQPEVQYFWDGCSGRDRILCWQLQLCWTQLHWPGDFRTSRSKRISTF